MMRNSLRTCGFLAVFVAAAACTELAESSPDANGDTVEVVARWDHLPAADVWTSAALEALGGPGRGLVETTPADIAQWCPAYPEASESAREAFWVGLVSSLAKHESTWRPGVSGGGGRWHGLLQISPGTARGYGCAAQSADALKSGPANLKCAIRIMGVTVPRDGVVSQGMRGVAADWGPFHQSSKREDMRAWTRAQPYCAENSAG